MPRRHISHHKNTGTNASGIYRISVSLPRNTTVATSKKHSPFHRRCRRYRAAAAASRLCFTGPTLSETLPEPGARRVLTSTKCIPFLSRVIMSISRCPHLKFLSRTQWPDSMRNLHTMSSPRRPNRPVPPESLLFSIPLLSPPLHAFSSPMPCVRYLRVPEVRTIWYRTHENFRPCLFQYQ